jgi:competence protein ComEC
MACLAAGLIASRWAPLPVRPAAAAAIGVAALLALALVRRAPRAAAGLLLAALAAAGLAWGSARMQATAAPAPPPPGGASGRVVVDVPPREGARGWTARGVVVALRVDGRPVRPGTRLLLDLGTRPPPELGTVLAVRGRARPAAGPAAPGWWRAFLARQRIALRVDAAGWRAAGRRGGPAGLRDRWRRWAAAGAGRGLQGDVAGVVRGMALGGGAGISEAAQQDFRDAGLWHLLAVSGQNVGVVALAALAALRAAGVGRRSGVAASGLVLGAYVLACDGGASVARAGVVGALGVLGELGSAPRLRWHLLLVGLAVILAVDPRAIEDPGLQLSFSAVVGLFVLAPPIGAWLCGWLPARVADLAGQAAACGLMTAPVLAWRFERLSLAGLVVNVVAVPLAAPVVVVALAGIAAGALLPAAGVACALIAGAGAQVLLWIAAGAAAVPGAAVDLPPWSALPLAALAAAPAVLAARAARARGGGRPPPAPSRAPTVAIAVAAAALAGWIAWPRGSVDWPATPEVALLDVGQGDAILLRDPAGAAVLVDAGPASAQGAPVVAALRRAGVRRLGLVVLTHGSADHTGGLPAVLAAVRVDRVLVAAADVASPGGRAALAAARRAGVAARPIAPGAHIAAGAWRLDALRTGPAGPGGDPNPRSLVVIARSPGLRALLAADAESGALGRVATGRVDVLKVAHHGSEDPGLPALLRRLRPAIALVSAGRGNPFGHPRGPTLAALRAAGASVWRTDVSGDVRVAAPGRPGGGLRVRAVRGPGGGG